ncbi:disintegrin and metalloproteinase domain-containing protein 21-like [Crocuta crocuta]
MSPNADITFRDTHCGNSLVEDREDCDCGFLNLCTKDPCCQSNYTLSPGAPCAFGLCCKDYKVMPSGDLCRQQGNECDFPEWCNGKANQCPEDMYMKDRVKCTGGSYCYGSRCKICDEQCAKFFGKEAIR